jgi:CO/xanthine dehydrogenase FAD-binding subunit
MPIKNYHRPADWDTARAALRDSPPLLLGPRVPIPPYGDAVALTDLSRLELNYITADSAGVHIGALTPLQALAESSQVGSLLNEAARLTTHYGLRNVATLGGLLLTPAGPPEILLALLVLDATLVIRGDSTREFPITNYSLQSGEMIAEVKFSQPTGETALERVTRTPRDEAIVAVAVTLRVDAGVCRAVKLAVAGAGPRPACVQSVENILLDQPLTARAMAEAAESVEAVVNPANDYKGSADYRRAMAGVLTRRALEKAVQGK